MQAGSAGSSRLHVLSKPLYPFQTRYESAFAANAKCATIAQVMWTPQTSPVPSSFSIAGMAIATSARHAAVIQAQCRRRCTPLRSSSPHPKFQKFQIDAQPRPTRSPDQLSTTQHDPARPSTAQHGSARLRTTQHGPEPLRVAPDLAGRQIKLLQISPNFATHLIACMMAKPSCLSTN